MMSLLFVAAGASDTANSATQLTLPVPAGVEEFDLLLVLLREVGGTWSSLGWIDLGLGANSTVMYRFAPPTPPANYAFIVSSSSDIRGKMVAYRGLTRGDEFDAATFQGASGTRTTSSGPDVTTTVKNDLLVEMVSHDASPTAMANIAHPAGFTERVNEEIGSGAIHQFIISDKIQSAVGATGTIDMTHDSVDDSSRHFSTVWKNGNLNKSHLAIGVL